MPDMLVRLWKLDFAGSRAKENEVCGNTGIKINRLLSPNFKKAEAFVREEFGEGWASEVTAAFYNSAPSCFMASKEGRFIGFACYNATGKGFFGPTGVSKECRGHGVGSCLLFRCLEALWEEGYAYAIIGGVGPKEYYERTAGATLIEDSSPGIYSRMVKG